MVQKGYTVPGVRVLGFVFRVLQVLRVLKFLGFFPECMAEGFSAEVVVVEESSIYG